MRACEESSQIEGALAVRRRKGSQDPPIRDLETGYHRNGPAGYWKVFTDWEVRRRNTRPVSAMSIAWGQAHLGDREHTFEWLERAVEERDGWVTYLKVEPAFAALRSDPRFQKIARSAGLP